MTEEPKKEFKSGLAVLVGRTNVGKSTLLNALVGTKVSIVTPKPQTTRETVHGVVNRPDGQIVLVDTPGFFKTHASRLVDSLHEKVREALEGADVVVHVVDPTRPIGHEDEMAREALKRVRAPRLLCLNKADVNDRPFRAAWLAAAASYAASVEVSALTRTGLASLVDATMRVLPVGPPLYPPGQVTNAHRDFAIAELIRESVYRHTGAEVPYRTSVEVDQVEERTDRRGVAITAIKAAILTSSDRYQRMLIGAGGRKVKEIGVAARRELEAMLGRKVFLDLAILVDPKPLLK